MTPVPSYSGTILNEHWTMKTTQLDRNQLRVGGIRAFELSPFIYGEIPVWIGFIIDTANDRLTIPVACVVSSVVIARRLFRPRSNKAISRASCIVMFVFHLKVIDAIGINLYFYAIDKPSYLLSITSYTVYWVC